MRNAVKGDKPITASIISLLNPCRPFHISGLIMPVIVFALKRVLGRRLSAQFCQEFFKRLKSKFNTTAAVVVKILCTGIRASLSSGMKSNILCRCRALNGFSVRGVTSLSQASAGLTSTPKQPIARNSDNLAALTFTIPILSAERSRGETGTGITENRPTAKNAISQIGKVGAGWKWGKFNVMFIVGHLAFSFVEQNLARAVQRLRNSARPAFILPQMEVRFG
jgi:hypothetical protein